MKIADKNEFEKQNVFGTGTPNTAYAKYFIGESYLNPLTNPEDGLHLLNVTFEPGCRNNWHIHPFGPPITKRPVGLMNILVSASTIAWSTIASITYFLISS